MIAILYLARWINKDHQFVVALTIGIAATIIPLSAFPFYSSTPIELAREKRKEECKKELENMYKTEYNVRRRYADIQNVLRLTDKYNVSILKILTLPSVYRNALFVGIGVGFSQGIINSFFENFVCALIEGDTSFLYCDSQELDLKSGFAYLLFLHALIVAPVLFFLYYLESIALGKCRTWKIHLIYTWYWKYYCCLTTHHVFILTLSLCHLFPLAHLHC